MQSMIITRPNVLTDEELITFARHFMISEGQMPTAYQEELIKRFTDKGDRLERATVALELSGENSHLHDE